MTASTGLFTLSIVLLVLEILIMLAFIGPVMFMLFKILQKMNRMFDKAERLQEKIEEKGSDALSFIQTLPDVISGVGKVGSALGVLFSKKRKDK